MIFRIAPAQLSPKHHLTFFSESSPCIPSSTTPPSSLANVALSKPVPRPLGSSPALFSNPNSPLQSLLYRHPYLSGTADTKCQMHVKKKTLNSLFIVGNPVTSISGVNGNPNPLTLPGSGTTVFPLPGSFPWAAGARGNRSCAQGQKSTFHPKKSHNLKISFSTIHKN